MIYPCSTEELGEILGDKTGKSVLGGPALFLECYPSEMLPEVVKNSEKENLRVDGEFERITRKQNHEYGCRLDSHRLAVLGVPLFIGRKGMLVTPGLNNSSKLPLCFVKEIFDLTDGHTVWSRGNWEDETFVKCADSVIDRAKIQKNTHEVCQ